MPCASIVMLGPLPDALHSRFNGPYRLVPLNTTESLMSIEVAVTTSMTGASAEQMAQLGALRLILCNGAGLDRIDLEEAERRGIEVFNTADAVTQDTADYAVTLMMAARRKVVEADRYVRDGQWGVRPWAPSRRLSTAKVGIVGLGKIGTAIAVRLTALGIRVAYHTPKHKPEVEHQYFGDLEELARWSDALLVCCPANAATYKMINAAVLHALGSSGTLINVSRGAVVAEDDLIDALRNGVIEGAALDVFENEPAIDARIIKAPNLILSPHAAAVTHETRQGMAMLLAERAHRYFAEQ
ncbi:MULTISPECIES: 2-hydroxyacid dehydrogenase [unclassified Pseudomonas]|uniref:2-hydroxyacid dehydrogenase n=1 Tax=unclassified Pseudomonas TaxID=196821 RepID=UPI000BD53D5D|nr:MULTISPECIES: 2-hydroxyacid dehydrogenase [unclassified Pseudomonas]PVZ10523.1 lactate dehydrogenase-like 2-hydroxyacid dehydrogenase [Pseudomonas sp. URIL14HWK12:I12]PVZ21949.1 lactate dehydrogenase-like 2-hydroxyacid dehydrogenase [Pseudomonas sp. URIL14HWK12:I10]PVZ30968.1 lactate dehydrogenase-like 2-hydroxyacid dehydrogenase [Pseudomonas sp. URIL14HWK12:I11]SNZ17436.1 D-isomer specific 2-hydroxyacid dehydrogenase, catalytic domain [Pseudomonas sp. URIL14HWK12:I9]